MCEQIRPGVLGKSEPEPSSTAKSYSNRTPARPCREENEISHSASVSPFDIYRGTLFQTVLTPLAVAVVVALLSFPIRDVGAFLVVFLILFSRVRADSPVFFFLGRSVIVPDPNVLLLRYPRTFDSKADACVVQAFDKNKLSLAEILEAAGGNVMVGRPSKGKKEHLLLSLLGRSIEIDRSLSSTLLIGRRNKTRRRKNNRMSIRNSMVDAMITVFSSICHCYHSRWKLLNVEWKDPLRLSLNTYIYPRR